MRDTNESKSRISHNKSKCSGSDSIFEANFSVMLKEIDDEESREFLRGFKNHITEIQKKEWNKAKN